MADVQIPQDVLDAAQRFGVNGATLRASDFAGVAAPIPDDLSYLSQGDVLDEPETVEALRDFVATRPTEDEPEEERTLAFSDDSHMTLVLREMSAVQFPAWLDAQNLGAAPYNGIGIHHTYIPTSPQYTSVGLIRGVFNYYQYGLGWKPGIGPHIWLIDERNPYKPGECLVVIGTHPRHDGIGISYRNHRWVHIEALHNGDGGYWTPGMVQTYRTVFQALCKRRGGTIKVHPGPSVDGPTTWQGGLYHRDAKTNPKTCPGNQITHQRFDPQLTAVLQLTGPRILGPHTATREQAESYLLSKPNGEYSDAEVRWIVGLYYGVCDLARMDAGLALAQMAHETGDPATGGVIASYWAARPRCNPAGIGVTGQPGAGVSFQDWRHSVVAHVGRLLAYARKDGDLDATQRMLVDRALAYRGLPLSYRGIAPTIDKLTGTWAADREYHHGVLRHYAAMRGA